MVVRTNPATNDSMETISCQAGTLPDGILAIITIGDEKGIMLPHTASGESGFPAAAVIMINDKMMGMVIGNINDCASWGSSFTTLPTAANREA